MSFDITEKSRQLEEQIKLDYAHHGRLSEFKRLVYPVISRRSGGLSLGVNLNPTKRCTFDCVYCQVDRNCKISNLTADLTQICQELEYWITSIQEKDNQYRGFSLKDISIAGDGEPTAVAVLPDLMRELIELQKKYDLGQSKLILFTNGSHIDRKDIDVVLPKFVDNNGEIWFKLDFWDQESLVKINRTKISASRLLRNLIKVGEVYSLVLQSCFFCWGGELFKAENYNGYIDLIKDLLQQGTKIDRIQAYTLARTPADERADPWSNHDMDALVKYLKSQLPVPIEKYYANGQND